MLFECPECSNMVSDKAALCPKCGYPFEKKVTTITRPKSRSKTKKRMRLPNGFGRITCLKGRNLRKPYRATVSVGKDEFGKPIGKLLKPEAYFETYNDAYAALIKYHDNPYEYGSELTVNELYEKWFEEKKKKVSKSRIRAIKAAWDFCSYLYHKDIKLVKTREIKYVLENASRVDDKGNTIIPSSATREHIKSVLLGMFDYAVECEYVDHNYVRDVKSVSFTRDDIKSHMTFTEDDIALLSQHVNENKYVGIIILQCYTGMRPSELFDIKLSNLNLKDWYMIGGSKTKAGKNRIIPIHRKVRSLIQSWYQEAVLSGNTFLFEQNHKKITYSMYKYHFDMVMNRYGLSKDHRPHDPRKTFVTMAKKYNVDEYAIKLIVGHAIHDITESVYTERDVSWLHRELNKIPC